MAKLLGTGELSVFRLDAHRCILLSFIIIQQLVSLLLLKLNIFMYKNTHILKSLLISIHRAIQTKVNLLHMYYVPIVNLHFELLISNGLF